MLEEKIKRNRLQLRKEIVIDIFGFNKELSVRRSGQRQMVILRSRKEIGYFDILDFFELNRYDSLPNAYKIFLEMKSPWYVKPMLESIYYESQSSGEDGNCWAIPKAIFTWENKHKLLVAKATTVHECDNGDTSEIEQTRYYFSVNNDSAQWIVNIQMNPTGMKSNKIGSKYFESILDSTLVSTYYYKY